MKTPTTKEIIESNRAAYLSTKTAAELKSLFEADGLATKQRWNKAVQAVIDIGGPDYYALRGQQRAASIETLRSRVSHKIELYVDAKAKCQRFAILSADRQPVWYGVFFDDDQSFSFGDRNEQSACELAAARKAIWLASKVKESLSAPAVRLTLRVDAQWLTSGGGKSAVLQRDARRFNIDLNLQWIPGTENPADEWTTASGFKKWSESDMTLLAVPFFPENETEKLTDAPHVPVADIVAEPTAAELLAAKNELENRAEQEREAKIPGAFEQLDRDMTRMRAGLRFGCEKKIRTRNQFENCIASLNRTREIIGETPLGADEIASLEALQNLDMEEVGQPVAA